jgi:hypothetical protein
MTQETVLAIFLTQGGSRSTTQAAIASLWKSSSFDDPHISLLDRILSPDIPDNKQKPSPFHQRTAIFQLNESYDLIQALRYRREPNVSSATRQPLAYKSTSASRRVPTGIAEERDSTHN